MSALSASGAWADWFAVEDPPGLPGYCLTVVDGGELRFCKSPFGSSVWEVIEDRERGTMLRLSEPDSEYHHRYLRYDPEGNDRAVSLARGQSPGCYWHAAIVKDTKGHIAAKSARVRGWYLNVGGKAGTVRVDGKEYPAYKAVLDPEPGKPAVFYFTAIAP
jgi:hypothetical protein